MKKAFTWLARQSERWPLLVLALVFIATVIAVNGITRIESDFDFQAMLPKGEESVQVWEEVEDVFGGTIQERVLLESEDILLADILRAVAGYQEFLKEESGVWGELVDAAYTPLDGMFLFTPEGAAVVDAFGRPVPLDPASLDDEELVAQVEANLEAQRQAAESGSGQSPLVSEDGRAMLINLDQVVAQNDALVNSFEDSTREYFQAAGVEGVYITGQASWTRDSNEQVAKDTSTLFVFAFVFILLVLFLTFRRVTDVLFTMFVVIVTIIWVMGLSGFARIPFTYPSVAIMPVLLGIGIAYAIHVLTRYYEERKKGEDTFLSTRTAVATVGVAVFLTAVTTAIGFASFGISEMPPMRDFGLMCLAGVIFSFLLAVTMLPSMIILRDRRGRKKKGLLKREAGGKQTFVDRALVAASLLAEHHRVVVLVVTAVIVAAGIFAGFNLDTKADFGGGFEDAPSFIADEKINDYFGGQMSAFTLVGGDLTDPILLQAMRDYEQALADSGALDEDGEVIFVRDKIFSIADVIANQSGGEIPATREEVLEILEFLRGFEGGGGPQLVNESLNKALIVSNMSGDNQRDLETVTAVLREKEGIIEEAEAGATVGQSGEPVLVSDLLGSLTPTMMKTSLLALLLCLLVVSLIFKSLIFGLAATSVVFVTIAMEFVALIVLGWPLDFMTVMVSALIIGTGIDFGIHVTHRFREEWSLGCENLDEAVRKTVGNVGRALLAAAGTTAGAFGILAISRVEELRRFGGVTAMSLIFALLVALLVLPTILSLWAERAEKRNAGATRCEEE